MSLTRCPTGLRNTKKPGFFSCLKKNKNCFVREKNFVFPNSGEINQLDFNQNSFLLYIWGVSEKYSTCVHVSVLVLFFVIRTVESFEVVPIWWNHTLPAVLPHLKAVLERGFWIVSMSSNRFPLSAIFNFGNIQKSQGAMSAGEAVQSCVSPKIAAQGLMNALARYRGEEASHRLTRNAVVFFSRHHAISSERNILCWSSDLLEQNRSAQHPHNRKK